MFAICNLIKRNSSLILHILCTVFLCILSSMFFNKFSDYLMFGNLFFALLVVYSFYRIIFKKIYADSFLKIVCILSILIAANRLYSYNKLIKVVPWFVKVNGNWLIVGITVALLLILLVFKLLTYIESYDKTKLNDKLDNANEGTASVVKPINNQHKSMFSFFKYLALFIGFCIVMLIPICLLYLFNKYGLDKTALDFDKVLTFLISYGSSFLLIVFALVIVIITLIYVAKYIYVQIRLFKKASQEDSVKSYPVPTYAFSVIVVCLLLFFAWRVADFSLADLTNELVIGDYLALPIAVMVTMILFFLLVQITHAIILLLSKMSAQNVKRFIEEQEKKMRVGARVTEIIQKIVDIILDTVVSTLDFVKFVPSFFGSMSKMVLLEDEVEIESYDKDGTYDNETVEESIETVLNQGVSKG